MTLKRKTTVGVTPPLPHSFWKVYLSLQQQVKIIATFCLIYYTLPISSQVNHEVKNGQCIKDNTLALTVQNPMVAENKDKVITSAYHSFCAGLINYSFFVPVSSSINSLNAQAIALSNNTLLTLLPVSCQEKYKRLICASVYKECNPTANLAQNSTWTYNTTTTSSAIDPNAETVPIFYKKPCKNLCLQTFDESSECGAVMKELLLMSSTTNNNYNPYIYNCSSKYAVEDGGSSLSNGFSIVNTNFLNDISYTFYDSSNNPAVCNSIKTSIPIVANQTEPYMGNTCQNLFNYPEFITSTFAIVSLVNNSPSNSWSSASSFYKFPAENVNGNSESNSIYIPPSSSVTNTSSSASSSSLPFPLSNNKESEFNSYNNNNFINFAPLLPPYYIQSYLEDSLETFVSQLPAFINFQCQDALRILLCAGTFMEPTTFTTKIPKSALPNISLPIVPAVELCTYVSESCSASYYSDWNSSYLEFNTILRQVINDQCSETTVHSPFTPMASSSSSFSESSSIAQYFSTSASINQQQQRKDNKSQTILTLETANYGTLAFNTSSNQMNITSTSSLISPLVGLPQITAKSGITYTIECPLGYEYGTIEDLTAPTDRNFMVEGTACVTECQAPIYTKKEYNLTNILVQVFTLISLIGTFSISITFYLFRYKKKQSLVLCMAISSCLHCLTQIPSFFVVPYPERYCIGNGTPISQSNGWSACFFQAIFMQYFGISTNLFWVAIASDLYFKIVWRYRNLDIYVNYWILIGWLLPLIPVIIIAAAKDVFGYATPLPWCYMGGWVENGYDYIFFFTPVFLITIAGTFFILRIIYEIFKVQGSTEKITTTRSTSTSPTNQHSNKSLRKLIERSKTLILFILFYLVVIYCLFSLRFIGYWYGRSITEAAYEWQECVFSNFFMGSQEYTDQTCGVTPSYTLSYWIYLVSSLVTLCYGCFLIPIFGVTKDNQKLWKEYLYKSIYRPYQMNHPDSWLTLNCCIPLCNHKYCGCHERPTQRTSFITPAQRRATQRASMVKPDLEAIHLNAKGVNKNISVNEESSSSNSSKSSDCYTDSGRPGFNLSTTFPNFFRNGSTRFSFRRATLFGKNTTYKVNHNNNNRNNQQLMGSNQQRREKRRDYGSEEEEIGISMELTSNDKENFTTKNPILEEQTSRFIF